MKIQFYQNIPMITEGGYHTLISGCTGSGKSVLLNGIVLHSLTIPGSGLYLIDPKKVELSQYKQSSHCICYGDTYETIEAALNQAVSVMEYRYKEMQLQGLRKSVRPVQFVIIDELAQFCKGASDTPLYKLYNLIAKIATLGRAANIFMIACTQRPTNDVVKPIFKINCDVKIALRCSTEQESRNIIGISDARYLPKHGKCIMIHPDEVDPVIWPVDYFTDETIEEFIRSERTAV